MDTKRVILRLTLTLAILSTACSFARAQTIQNRVKSNGDDAEESSAGTMSTSSTTLRLGQQKWIGMRFQTVGLPQGCTILDAYVVMTATATSSQPTQLTLCAYANDTPPAFGSSNFYITNLAKTTASVPWTNVTSWTSGQTYQTPSLVPIVQELVNRAAFTTSSGIDILIRSDDLTGSRTCQSYNGSSVTAPLLVVSYTTATASATPTSNRLYVERLAWRTAPSASSWQSIDLSVSPFNVPPNKVVELSIVNTDTANQHYGGARAVGSSLDRRFQIQQASTSGLDSVVMQVQTNASSKVEIYADSTSTVWFTVLGYWTKGSYTEKMQSFTIGSAATWVDKTLGTYGVGANQVAEIVLTNANATTERLAGVRSKGSSLARQANLNQASGGGVDSATMFVRTSKSSDATIQAYAANTTDITFYLLGYWSQPPGKYTETYTDLGVPTATNTWQTKSLASAGVPANAVADILMGNFDGGADRYTGVRETSSTNGRVVNPHKAAGGGGDYHRMHVSSDSSSNIQWYSEVIDPTKVDIFLTGYWKKAPANVLMVVTDTLTPSTADLDRTTLIESWGYVVSFIDDGDTQANFNAAFPNYDLLYIPADVNLAVGPKVSGTSLGIVSEHFDLVDDLGFASSAASTTGTAINIADNTHYITSPFSVGTLTILTSSQTVTTVSGTPSSELLAPAQWGTSNALITLESGAHRYDNVRTTGRRVQLPWGGSSFNINVLNASGKTIMQRSLQWASALKGAWNFDETTGTTATDSSPYKLDGTLSGGQTFDANSVTGKVSKGLDFNGTSHYVEINDTPVLQITSALTISAWIKGDSWPTGTNVGAIFRKGDANPNNYELSVSDGRLELLLDGNDEFGFRGNTLLQTGTWYFVVATWDGTNVKLYVNAVLDSGAMTYTTPLGTDSRAEYIGGRIGNTDFFDGTIDSVRVYNYALQPSEITALKHATESGVRVLKWYEVQ